MARTHVKLATLTTAALSLVFVSAATATGAGGTPPKRSLHAPAPLVDAATSNPDALFDVIVVGHDGGSARAVDAVRNERARGRGNGAGLKRGFVTVNAASAQLTGAEVLELAAQDDVLAVVKDQKLRAAASGGGGSNSNTTCDPSTCIFWQGIAWPQLVGNAPFIPSSTKKNSTPVPQAPAIAIVDSGVDPAQTFTGKRLVHQASFVTAGPNSSGDGYGHGTFVAGLAAGLMGGFAGASPTSNLVSLDVVDDNGSAVMSDVIAAADWIYQNKSAYGIRVANFSLIGTEPSSFMFDPLDKALERLWFSGVVVVAAAGNYGTDAQPSGVPYSPGNDPFIITVGATDMNKTVAGGDDFVAPWSAWGYTLDGFAKPDLSAPGRYMIGSVPLTAAMPIVRPDRVIADTWMWMSGTSFAAPVVAGGAADVLAVHPNWTPDQVKGALMLKATPLPGADWRGGVGQVRIDAAASVTDPPNPNAALNQFVVPDPAGGPTPVFDSSTWTATASADPLWSAAAWTSAAWTTAAWTTAAWTTAAWTTAAWTTAAWTSAAWTTEAHSTAVDPTAVWVE